MPVVSLSYNRLLELISGGKKITKHTISQKLPYLGLDIESDDGDDTVRIEYSPNRPDYATDIGVSLALQGLLEVKKGLVPFEIKRYDTKYDYNDHDSKGNDTTVQHPYHVNVTHSVTKIRPILTGIIAKGGILDDTMLRQLVTLQEDIHFGLGRNRKKVAIGLHDLSKMQDSFPLQYTTVPTSHTFVPLHQDTEMSISQIIKHTKIGQEYAHLLYDDDDDTLQDSKDNIPIILDSHGNTISLPPIINSDMTAITTDTSDIFVDVTGTSQYSAENALAIIALTLHAAGFKLESLSVQGGKNRTPPLSTRIVSVTLEEINSILGLHLSAKEAMLCLQKCRLDPTYGQEGISCIIPPYRFDIISAIDLVEEVALGYGTWRLEPILSHSKTFGSYEQGEMSRIIQTIDKIMVGMGHIEALNSCLTSAHTLYEMVGRKTPKQNKMISTANSKSSEHEILRDSLLPGLVENISKNIHESYPHELYETGVVFSRYSNTTRQKKHGGKNNDYNDKDGEYSDQKNNYNTRYNKNAHILEKMHFAALIAHTDANFSEAKSTLQTAISAMYNKLQIHTVPKPHKMFADGRCAKVVISQSSSPSSLSSSSLSSSSSPTNQNTTTTDTIGYIGEIDPKILATYRIRVPVSGFEISLSDLSASTK